MQWTENQKYIKSERKIKHKNIRLLKINTLFKASPKVKNIINPLRTTYEVTT